MNKILHVMRGKSVFNIEFVNLLNRHFASERHQIALLGSVERTNDSNVVFINTLRKGFELIKLMNNSENIFIHGLFSKELVLLLFGQPWLLKKSYWVIWGGDLYYYKFRNQKKNKEWKLYRRNETICWGELNLGSKNETSHWKNKWINWRKEFW